MILGCMPSRLIGSAAPYGNAQTANLMALMPKAPVARKGDERYYWIAAGVTLITQQQKIEGNISIRRVDHW
jgi:hypothetical protein